MSGGEGPAWRLELRGEEQALLQEVWKLPPLKKLQALWKVWKLQEWWKLVALSKVWKLCGAAEVLGPALHLPVGQAAEAHPQRGRRLAEHCLQPASPGRPGLQ